MKKDPPDPFVRKILTLLLSGDIPTKVVLDLEEHFKEEQSTEYGPNSVHASVKLGPVCWCKCVLTSKVFSNLHGLKLEAQLKFHHKKDNDPT